ncbi:MAG: hypothetical protein R2820_15695 [Cyclobacteriaceae bacterium]|nr:hypothetical protein [Cyclobacteriaceae bacterium]
MKKRILFLTLVVLVAGRINIFAQDTKIRFFGQPEITNYQTTEKNRFNGVSGLGEYITSDSTQKSKTNFNTGNFVLFVTSQLSERLSVLGEANFNNKKNTYNFEIQRLMVRYYFQDYFSVRVGKMFTPIGYWNNQYTMGLVLQPTIQRPFAIRPISEGGPLQYRDIGVQFEGDNIGKARLSYKILLGNGIGYYGSSDKSDNHVATTVQLGAEPVEGLKVMASGMFDRIEQGKPNPNGSISSLPDNGDLQLLVGSVAYMNPEKKIEAIAEILSQTSKFDNLGDYRSFSYYMYGGFKVTDKLTPYVLYNYTQAGRSTTEGDLYFAPIPVQVNQVTLGVRYKLNSNFVCKLEYETENNKTFYQDIVVPGLGKRDDGFVNSVKNTRVRMQFAFVF